MMERYLGQDGLLSSRFSGFEARKGQIQMAEAVSDVLATEIFEEREEAEILVVEAETGIGKTIAYLLPAILSGKRTVISTATITLQDQILKKEIPFLEQMLGQQIPVVCVKGRQNYLCLYRWRQYRSSRMPALVEDEVLSKIDAWLESTETGDKAELSWLRDSSSLWPQISSQSHQCLGSDCPEASYCFINELRKNAGLAQLLVVNHHLFFSDLALRSKGYGEVLPRYEGVIFDEAHHIENVASTFFGKRFSQYQVYDFVVDVERQAEADLSPSRADKIIAMVRSLKGVTEQFSDIFPSEKGRFPLFEFIENTPAWYDLVKELSASFEHVEKEIEELDNNGEGWRTLARRVHELHDGLIAIALPDVVAQDGAYVHWYERRDRAVALSATPVQIAGILQDTLYRETRFCIFTSATLTSGGDFSYVCDRLGLVGDVTTRRFASPFNYQENAAVYVPDNSFPMPTDHGYSDALCREIEKIIEMSKGRALVLCTSFRGMDLVASYLEERVEYPILVQGSASRHALLLRFREEESSVLVAVASFWEGIDVPGSSLSCVIIDKLPFEVPSDPVLQARITDVRDSGGNPFFDFQVPRAILTLRQGVGRLIRTGSDKGLIALMDTRLYKKGYGRVFRASLPPAPVVRSMELAGAFLEKIDEM